MLLSHRLTFSILSIFLLVAFVALPVMAHQLDPEVPPHDSANPDTAGDAGTDHALVRSITVSSGYLTATSPITATITFADGVAAIADDTATTGTGNNEARHAILSNPTGDLGATNLTIMVGTKKSDGSGYDYAAIASPYSTGNVPQITNVIKTRTEGSGATGSGAVYTAYISIPTDAATALDGQYSISVATTAGVFNPANVRGEFRMDTQMPTVEDADTRAIGQDYANLQGEWSDPFEITFALADPMDSADFNADPVVFLMDSASGLKLSTLMFDVDTNNELTFGNPQFIGSGKYVVKVTPVTATTVKPAATVKVTIKVKDMAGNEGMSEALTIKLAQRAATGTGTGPGDETPPTVTIASAAGTGSDANKVIFTFTFSEALATTGANAFTVDDIIVSNAPTLVAANLTTTDNTVFKLTVTPENEKFPVKVSFKPAAKIGDAADNLMVAAQLAKTDTYTPEGVLGVEIDAPTALEFGVLTFTFTFAEEPAQPTDTAPNPPGAFTVNDVRASNAQPLVAANLRRLIEGPDDTSGEVVYELDVTPMDPTKPVRVQLLAKSVSNGGAGTTDDPLLVAGEVDATFTPTPPPAAATITSPTDGNAGSVTAGSSITITFSKDPGTVMANGATLAGTGTTRMLTAGNVASSVSLTWTGTDAGTSDDGSGTITYAISGSEPNTSPDITIAAGGFVVIVRDTNATMGALLRTYDSSIALTSWADMPDLQNIFDTGIPLTGAAHGGGALILRQSGTTAVHPGTVGISEIMWAINEAHLNNEVRRKADQWIELHNLNTTAVTVKLSWKTGAKAIAGDANINGNLAAPYLDVVTNVFHDRPGNAHWILPGQNGNPLIGKHFISAARKGTFSLDSKHDNKFNKRYTRSDKGQNASNSPDGRNKDQWEASPAKRRYAYRTDTITTDDGRSFNVAYEDHGTPGRKNTFDPQRADTTEGRTDVKINTIVFNEIANRSNPDYEWIELRNVSNSEINLKNYLISIVESKPEQADRDKPDNDKIFYQFPSNDKAKIAAGGVFLLVASDPRGNPDHPLAVGYNVDLDDGTDEEQVVGSRKNPVKYKVMRKSDQAAYQYEGKGLPDTGKFVLILRRPDNHEGHRSGADGGKGVAERGKDDLDKVVDVAGWHDDLKITNYPNVVSSTNLWPLRNFEALNFDRNKFNLNTVHHRKNLSSRGSHNDHRAAWQDAGYTGIGYKHQAADSAAHGGTPGYHGNIRGKAADLAADTVVISEIMLSQGERGNLPQWIELYNPSKTHAVNLADNAGWRLVIENPDRAPIITINFKNDGNVKYIPPNSTVLIVSSSARDYGSDTLPRGTVFPNTRVLNAYTALRGETFEIKRGDPLLDPKAFNVRLLDGKTTNNKPDGRYAGEVSDEIGNLDGNPRTNDEAAWEYPSGMTADGYRTSLIRIFDDRDTTDNVPGVARDGTLEVEPMGGTRAGVKTRVDGVVDSKYGWVHAVDTEGFQQLFVRHTWYGDENDYGTPADRTGQTLPVSLSHFRPTLENGEVVIRWTTESELDNAGFNILRSDTRNGEFKQVNAELIQGHGTTGERHTYKWVDESAKPGVVYYYQIEDVSFAGERQTLQTTKLKGLISAVGKATTTWGDIKEVQ